MRVRASFKDPRLVELTISFSAPVNHWEALARQLADSNTTPSWEFGEAIQEVLLAKMKTAIVEK